jgi:5,5'-dehydrodivanillate O-demethylase
MLSEEENQRLTQVGPGTPMGDLLRRYWHPVAAEAELDERPTRPIRLLGEDLVLYRCADGSYGLLDRYCAHRLTDLAFGSVEDCALRCPRHGWLYANTGHCIDQPFEDELVEVKLNAYQAQAKGGMIWAYTGPEPAPLVPDWEPFGWQDGLVQVVLSALPCNWLQCQENSVDAIDMEAVEAAFEEALKNGTPPELPEGDFAFDEFEHGFVVRNAADDSSKDEAPAVTKTSIWPNALFAGDSRSCRLEWRVPMDDTLTLNVSWFFDRVAAGAEVPEPRIRYWYATLREEETGEALRTHLLNRKFAIWINQDPIVDRTREHLSEGDEGLLLLRGKLFSQMALIADGGEPKGVIRNPVENQALRLPFTQPGAPLSPRPEAATEVAFPYLAGQPEDAAEAYRKVVESWRPKDPSESP